MSVNKAFFRIAAGAELAPPSPNGQLSGNIRVGTDLTLSFPNSAYAWEARVISSANQPLSVYAEGGILVPSNEGFRQEEVVLITAAGGATAPGNLSVTVTASHLLASPVTVLVPLRPTLHTTPVLIATAMAAALADDVTLAPHFTFTASDQSVKMRSIYPFANQAALNLAITAGLGVTAVANSTTLINGVAGIVIERAGTPGHDAFNREIPAGQNVAMFLKLGSEPGATMRIENLESALIGGVLYAGGLHALAGGPGIGPHSLVQAGFILRFPQPCTLDLLFIAHS